jgi:hypothetical protein
MNVVAWVYVVTAIITALLPGSPYYGKPEIDWSRPNVYVLLVSALCSWALVIWTLA